MGVVTTSTRELAQDRAWLRSLDFEDLYILSLSHKELRCAQIVKIMRISFPAVSQRIKKINSNAGYDVFVRNKGAVELSEDGMLLAAAAAKAVEALTQAAHVKLREEVEVFGETDDCGYLGSNV